MQSKIRNRILILLFGAFTLGSNLHGQINPDPVLEENLERLSERATSESALSDALEDVIALSQNPIDLNNAVQEDLLQIPYLTKGQVDRLTEYRLFYGEIFSIFELASIPGFDSTLIRKIEPYIVLEPISVTPRFTPRSLLKAGRQDFLIRFEQTLPEAKGYIKSDTMGAASNNASYSGSPQRYYFRYNYAWYDKIRVGLSGEKDPGEQFFRGAQRSGMDFYAGFLSVGNLGILKNLIIGNFRAAFGTGLTFGSGLSMGSMPGFSVASYQTSTFNAGGGIRPSLSVSEGEYLRGIALTLKSGALEMSTFASWHPRDANLIVNDTLPQDNPEVSSLNSTGYHRTLTEISEKGNIRELISGFNLKATFVKGINFGMRIGATGIFSKWSARIDPEVKIYNIHSFRGDENLVVGFDWLLRYKSFFFTGEISRSANGGLAFLSMATISPDPRVGFTLIYRNYQPTYQNLSGNAFGQNSNNTNEHGIYASVNILLNKKITLSLFGDFYSFPWLKYRINRPVQGYETGVMAGWQSSRSLNFTFRYYQKEGALNSRSGDSPLYAISATKSRSYRISINWVPNPGLMLNTRLEVRETKTNDRSSGYGYLACQDLQVKSGAIPLTGTLRYALFDIPVYDQRIYIYEPEVLYGYSMPAYSGRGIRVCLVLKYAITRWCQVWARGAVTHFNDRTEVGSGLEVRAGNIITELTGQVMFRFY